MDIAPQLQQLQQLEELCQRLYTAQTVEERSHVEETLRVFGQSTDYIVHCKAILDNSSSPYAQLLASSSLLRVITEHSLSPVIRLEMRNYFLAYLDSRGPALEQFVVTSIVQLLCRTVKLGWFDNDTHRNIVEDCKRFLEKGTPGHYLLGLKILDTLVAEMNEHRSGRTLTHHRKIAVSFKDTALLKVFQLCLFALEQLKMGDEKLREQGLQLALQCLSFDFVGTCLDDSTEDLTTIQVPPTWRGIFEDPATVQLFFDYYNMSTPPQSNVALECLVRLASVRRSLFANEAERNKFLNRLVNGTHVILQSQKGLNEHANYHEFCRLLGRLKTNYQLSELVAVEAYVAWISRVADFTINSLQLWQWAQGSIYYLLGLWSRLVSSMPYLKGESPSLLEASVPKITQAYITSRLESVTVTLANGGVVEDMLDSEEQLQEQLDSLPNLFRFQYDKSSLYICNLMDPIIEACSSCTNIQPQQAAEATVQLPIIEGRLTWMVYIVGAVVRGRLSASMAESQEAIDGDLAARVFGLLRIIDDGFHTQRYSERSRQRLDIAIIAFFQCFRKVYIGETVMHSSKVYTRLNERLGLNDHLAVLNVMLAKIATNLKVYGSCEELVQLTLNLFQDLANGYMSGKLLLKLDAISFVLSHHTSEYYAFLDHPSNTRNRSLFYSTLARLLFMEDTPQKFKAFVLPLQQVLVGLGQACATASTAAALRQAVPNQTVIGLFRDLRGIACATSSRRTYCMLFDWLYPAHFPTILRCLEAWVDDAEVTTPLLKFVAEFAYNKSQRLTFDSSSPNGILLFREVSKVLVLTGQGLLRAAPNRSNVYGRQYKAVWICLLSLSRAMSGNYVNFGVFELYGDRALKDALDVALRMALSIPLNDIIAYRKVSRAYFGFLEVLCQSHTSTIAVQDTATFTLIMRSLEMGLRNLEVSISSCCAQAVDSLAGFYFRNVVQQGADGPSATPGAAAMVEHIRQQPLLFPEILKTLFEIVLFEDFSNQWSLSRPILSLILCIENYYEQLKQELMAGQPLERQATLNACLHKLMADVQRNLEPKNRDHFTQNLTLVRHDYRSKAW